MGRGATSGDDMRHLILLSILAALSTTAHAIVVRHDIDPTSYYSNASNYPALFAIYRTKQNNPDCIASLIAPQWAITAAHCTEDPVFLTGIKKKHYEVMLGEEVRVLDQVVRYKSEDGNELDIALVHFSEPVSDIVPLPLYRHDDELGRIVIIPGWGDSGTGISGVDISDGVFRVAENRIDAVTPKWLVWVFDDPRSKLNRALTYEGISGPGDSGGPALIMTTKGLAIAGISSGQKTFGRPEGVYGAEEYYVRVFVCAQWIDETIGKK